MAYPTLTGLTTRKDSATGATLTVTRPAFTPGSAESLLFVVATMGVNRPTFDDLNIVHLTGSSEGLTSTSYRLNTYWKSAASINQASEPTTYDMAFSQARKAIVTVFVVTNAATDAPTGTAVSFGSTTTVSTISNSLVTTAGPESLIVMAHNVAQATDMVAGNAAYYAPGAGMTELVEQTNTYSATSGQQAMHLIAGTAQAAAAQTVSAGTHAWTRSGTNPTSNTAVKNTVAILSAQQVPRPSVTVEAQHVAYIGEPYTITASATNNPTSWENSLFEVNGTTTNTTGDTGVLEIQSCGQPVPPLSGLTTNAVTFTPTDFCGFTVEFRAVNAGGRSQPGSFASVIVRRR